MTLYDLKIKHDKLKKLDGGSFFKGATYKIFGSDTHRYKFYSCLTLDALQDFEKFFSVTLPYNYKNFIAQIGNGGSGPAYGLLRLSDWNIELEINENNFLATDFPHADKWNVAQEFNTEIEGYTETEDFQKWEEYYFSTQHITGSMRICHYGCAIYYLLVLTGNNAGQIWVDDRANDDGIYPAISKSSGMRLTFLEWYDEWLTESLKEFAS
ncbi:MAG: SMI1/KNR4 family protein [Ferruginibacter sp.]